MKYSATVGFKLYASKTYEFDYLPYDGKKVTLEELKEHAINMFVNDVFILDDEDVIENLDGPSEADEVIDLHIEDEDNKASIDINTGKIRLLED